MDASLLYLPSAFVLGAMHALEPGHAKTLTASYLIGIKGTASDAVVLGVSVAVTHSIVVILLACAGVYAGQAAFTDNAIFYLQVGSGLLVCALGTWLLWRRLSAQRIRIRPHTHTHGGPLSPIHQHHHHDHHHEHEHDHAHLDDDAHARAHAAQLPAYVSSGERPSFGQIVAFGAAGGLVPCPAAVSVMLLSVSLSRVVNGLLLVLGFSLGLACTLVCVGLAVVLGLQKIAGSGKFTSLSRNAPVISAVLVIFSGLFALLIAFR